MRSAGKVVVIGLDVGDGRLIETWARDGHLPVLASLMEGGNWSPLKTPADVLHVSAWPSTYTGAPPGMHGVYYTFQPVPGEQGYRKFHAGQYGCPTFWSVLSQAGVRCVVLDAPYTHPEEGSRAVQVFDWGTWARYWRRSSMPKNLIRKLDRACGRYPLGLEALDVGLGPLEPADMERRLTESARAKGMATVWLMQQTEWDLFFSVFAETHAGAHYCWSPAANANDPEQVRLIGIYREIDAGIGAILEAAGPQASLVVISGDGVGANRAGWHLLPEVLRRLGYLGEPSGGGGAAHDEGPPGEDGPPADTRPNDPGEGRRFRDPVRLLRDLLPPDFRKSLARRLPDRVRHRLAQRVDMAAVDWSRTRAYCLPTDLEGYIRINLEGREPEGVVKPGADYRRVCDEIVAALEDLVDPATGQRSVRRVIRSDEAFPGPRRDHLPDLIVIWDPAVSLDRFSSPAIGTVAGESPDARLGTHAAPGFALRWGEVGDREAGAALGHVCDLAPELLSRFGVPIPDSMNRALPGDPATGQGGGA